MDNMLGKFLVLPLAFLLFEREELVQNINLILRLRYVAPINDMIYDMICYLLIPMKGRYIMYILTEAIIKYFNIPSLIIISN